MAGNLASTMAGFLRNWKVDSPVNPEDGKRKSTSSSLKVHQGGSSQRGQNTITQRDTMTSKERESNHTYPTQVPSRTSSLSRHPSTLNSKSGRPEKFWTTDSSGEANLHKGRTEAVVDELSANKTKLKAVTQKYRDSLIHHQDDAMSQIQQRMDGKRQQPPTLQPRPKRTWPQTRHEQYEYLIGIGRPTQHKGQDTSEELRSQKSWQQTNATSTVNSNQGSIKHNSSFQPSEDALPALKQQQADHETHFLKSQGGYERYPHETSIPMRNINSRKQQTSFENESNKLMTPKNQGCQPTTNEIRTAPMNLDNAGHDQGIAFGKYEDYKKQMLPVFGSKREGHSQPRSPFASESTKDKHRPIEEVVPIPTSYPANATNTSGNLVQNPTLSNEETRNTLPPKSRLRAPSLLPDNTPLAAMNTTSEAQSTPTPVSSEACMDISYNRQGHNDNGNEEEEEEEGNNDSSEASPVDAITDESIRERILADRHIEGATGLRKRPENGTTTPRKKVLSGGMTTTIAEYNGLIDERSRNTMSEEQNGKFERSFPKSASTLLRSENDGHENRNSVGFQAADNRASTLELTQPTEKFESVQQHGQSASRLDRAMPNLKARTFESPDKNEFSQKQEIEEIEGINAEAGDDQQEASYSGYGTARQYLHHERPRFRRSSTRPSLIGRSSSQSLLNDFPESPSTHQGNWIQGSLRSTETDASLTQADFYDDLPESELAEKAGSRQVSAEPAIQEDDRRTEFNPNVTIRPRLRKVEQNPALGRITLKTPQNNGLTSQSGKESAQSHQMAPFTEDSSLISDQINAWGDQMDGSSRPKKATAPEPESYSQFGRFHKQRHQEGHGLPREGSALGERQVNEPTRPPTRYGVPKSSSQATIPFRISSAVNAMFSETDAGEGSSKRVVIDRDNKAQGSRSSYRSPAYTMNSSEIDGESFLTAGHANLATLSPGDRSVSDDWNTSKNLASEMQDADALAYLEFAESRDDSKSSQNHPVKSENFNDQVSESDYDRQSGDSNGSLENVSRAAPIQPLTVQNDHVNNLHSERHRDPKSNDLERGVKQNSGAGQNESENAVQPRKQQELNFPTFQYNHIESADDVTPGAIRIKGLVYVPLGTPIPFSARKSQSKICVRCERSLDGAMQEAMERVRHPDGGEHDDADGDIAGAELHLVGETEDDELVVTQLSDARQSRPLQRNGSKGKKKVTIRSPSPRSRQHNPRNPIMAAQQPRSIMKSRSAPNLNSSVSQTSPEVVSNNAATTDAQNTSTNDRTIRHKRSTIFKFFKGASPAEKAAKELEARKKKAQKLIDAIDNELTANIVLSPLSALIAQARKDIVKLLNIQKEKQRRIKEVADSMDLQTGDVKVNLMDLDRMEKRLDAFEIVYTRFYQEPIGDGRMVDEVQFIATKVPSLVIPHAKMEAKEARGKDGVVKSV